MTHPIKVSLYNQGCRLNQSETATISQSFIEKGYEVVPFKESADIVIINTCTVTENGDSDAKRLVNKVMKLNSDVKIVLVGCMAQIQKETLLEWPGVTWVVGNSEKMKLAELISDDGFCEGGVLAPKMSKEAFSIETHGIDPSRVRANIKIQDGCDFYCAFCVIPFARGPARSRDYNDTIKEVNALVDAGHQEIVVTGINLGTYSNSESTFVDVIKAMEDIEGLKRIRISSIEPTTIPKDLLKMMNGDTKLCRYLHIPLQSGTDEILGRMKRKYTMAEFDDFIQYAYDTVPDICIGSDVIVGFPGETDELFDQTRAYLAEAPIHYMHVFSYSERQFARSRKMDGQIEKPEISRRSAILRQMSQRQWQQYQDRFVGQTLDVLFEQEKNGLWTGLTDHYLKVGVESNEIARNEWGRIKVTSVGERGLVGGLV